MFTGVTLPISSNISNVEDEELYAYCYRTMKALNLLNLSAYGADDVDVWTDFPEWSGSPDHVAYVEQSVIWECLKSAHSYANGGPMNFNEGQTEDLLVQLAQWLCATFAYREFNGNGCWGGETTIYKFIARLKLDFEWNVADKFVSIESGWYPHAHAEHLNIFEMTLLAGMDNIRSVRNATYDKENPLKTIKEGRNVLVTIPEARRWLQGKKGFIPTVGRDYGNAN